MGSASRDDGPSNGMALCRLCHWYFDEGLMSVGKGYEVLVSKRIFSFLFDLLQPPGQQSGCLTPQAMEKETRDLTEHIDAPAIKVEQKETRTV
ncbi:MAG: HNH endonuclease [Deltaproteobacteria bacterium]|nr:HNH endonuclease [Deltaproteobacteria bacterium]